MKTKAVLNWSGGKDSLLCLHRLSASPDYEVCALLTVLAREEERIAMHGVRKTLLETQARSLGLPLHVLSLPEMPSDETYTDALTETWNNFQKQDIHVSVYGDIFLEDLRAYRERQLTGFGIRGLFPLWKIPGDRPVREFIDSGYKAIVTCVDENRLPAEFAGRMLDRDFLRDLPAGIDPCGENGEYHSFVFDGPLFTRPVSFVPGARYTKTYAPDRCFSYMDLLPAEP